VKANLIVPRSTLPQVITDLTEFDTFHVSEKEGAPSDPQLDSLSLQAYRLFLDIDDILKALNVQSEIGLIETLTKGTKVEKEKFKASDWADFISRIEAGGKPLVEEFKAILNERSELQKKISDNVVLKETFDLLPHLSVDLNVIGRLRRFHIILSIVSAKDIQELSRSLPEDIFLSTPIDSERNAIVVATSKEGAERVDKVLRSFEVRPLEIPERLPQSPAEALKVINQELEGQNLRLQELNQMLDANLKKSERKLVSLREGAKTAYDVLTEVKKAGDLKRFAVITGFYPTTRDAEFKQKFSRWLLFTEKVELAEHHHEFIAAETRDSVHFTHTIGEAMRHFDQQQVAHIMPVRIVERFEIVQVEEHHRAIMAAAFAGGHRLSQAVVHQAAIGKLRQGVIESKVANQLLGLLALGDVLSDTHQFFNAAILVLDGNKTRFKN